MKNAIREIETFHKELHCRISRSKRIFEKGLNMTQLQIMHYLFKHPDEEVCQRDLEDFLHLKKATIAESLDRLEQKGFIEREVSKTDRRRKNVMVSREELEEMKENFRKLDETADVITRDISEKEMEVFFRVLEKMKENLKKGDVQ